MTTPLTFPEPQGKGGGLDRRKMLTGAAALAAASAVTLKAASAAIEPPPAKPAAPPLSPEPLPLGPLPGSRYPDAHLESAKPKLSFGPNGYLPGGRNMAGELVATGM